MQNNNQPMTFEQFVSLVKIICTTWLPKLSELAGTDVYFCGYIHSSWNILLEDDVDKVKAIYHGKAARGKWLFDFVGDKMIIDQNFLEWCGNRNCEFSIGGDGSYVQHLELHNIFTFPDNVKFVMNGGVFFLTKCNLSGAVDPILFDIKVQRIYLTECRLSNKILEHMAVSQFMDFSWCNGWDDIETIHTRNISIKFDMMSHLPKQFNFLPDDIFSCGIIGMTKQHKQSACNVPSSYLGQFFTKATMSELTIRCCVEDDFRPLSLLFIQRLTKITATFYTNESALKKSIDIVIEKINASKGSINKTELLLLCQEELIDAGYSKYAHI